jgi:predicted metalloprotease with PDZ domain
VSFLADFNCLYFKGDRFLTVYILFLPQIKLGLSVKAANNMIILKKVSDEGLAAGLLEIGDIILDIDGIRVTSAQDFKDRMVGGLKTRGYVSTVIRLKYAILTHLQL